MAMKQSYFTVSASLWERITHPWQLEEARLDDAEKHDSALFGFRPISLLLEPTSAFSSSLAGTCKSTRSPINNSYSIVVMDLPRALFPINMLLHTDFWTKMSMKGVQNVNCDFSSFGNNLSKQWTPSCIMRSMGVVAVVIATDGALLLDEGSHTVHTFGQ